MSDKIENPPAFPLPLGTGDRADPSQSGGMTLRDYFAAQLVPTLYTEACREGENQGYPTNWRGGVVIEAYQMADAMLLERVK
jgi:hypothetical protein